MHRNAARYRQTLKIMRYCRGNRRVDAQESVSYYERVMAAQLRTPIVANDTSATG